MLRNVLLVLSLTEEKKKIKAIMFMIYNSMGIRKLPRIKHNARLQKEVDLNQCLGRDMLRALLFYITP